MTFCSCWTGPLVAPNILLVKNNPSKENSKSKKDRKIENEKNKNKNEELKKKKKKTKEETKEKRKEKGHKRDNNRTPGKTSERLKSLHRKGKERNEKKFTTYSVKPTKLRVVKENTPVPSIVQTQTMVSTSDKKEKLELVDEQWTALNYRNASEVRLDKVQITNTVSIFNCENSNFIIDADKFKSLQVQNCVKCNIVLKSLISAIEIISSNKMKIQVTGRCSCITIDKCIGVDVYLSKENEETEFTTALSAEMNVHIEGNTPEEDWKEVTIPEQFQHVLDKGNLSTRVSDLYKF